MWLCSLPAEFLLRDPRTVNNFINIDVACRFTFAAGFKVSTSNDDKNSHLVMLILKSLYSYSRSNRTCIRVRCYFGENRWWRIQGFLSEQWVASRMHLLSLQLFNILQWARNLGRSQTLNWWLRKENFQSMVCKWYHIDCFGWRGNGGDRQLGEDGQQKNWNLYYCMLNENPDGGLG